MTQQAEPVMAGVPEGDGGLPGESGEGEGVVMAGAGGWGAVSWTGTWVLLLSIAAVVNAGLVAASGGLRGFFLPAIAVCVCVLAALFDAWTNRIPNALTYGGILAGLALNILAPLVAHYPAAATWLGAVGPWRSIAGLGACILLVLLGYSLLALPGVGMGMRSLIKGVPLGDMKLLAAVAAIVGIGNLAIVTACSLTFGLIIGVINLLMMGRLNLVLRLTAHRLLELFYLRKLQTELPAGGMREKNSRDVPMAIPLALGVVVTVWWQARYNEMWGLI